MPLTELEKKKNRAEKAMKDYHKIIASELKAGNSEAGKHMAALRRPSSKKPDKKPAPKKA